MKFSWNITDDWTNAQNDTEIFSEALTAISVKNTKNDCNPLKLLDGNDSYYGSTLSELLFML